MVHGEFDYTRGSETKRSRHKAHAVVEIRTERYGNILRAWEYHVRCFVISHISLVMTLQIQICCCTGIVHMSRDQNAGRNHSVRTDNSTFERVEEFKYLETTLTNQNSIPEEIKSRFRSGNPCYHSVQNRLSSMFLSNNLKIKIYRTIILPVAFMSVKLGRRHWGRKGSWECLRIWCWGEYLDLAGTR